MHDFHVSSEVRFVRKLAVAVSAFVLVLFRMLRSNVLLKEDRNQIIIQPLQKKRFRNLLSECSFEKNPFHKSCKRVLLPSREWLSCVFSGS